MPLQLCLPRTIELCENEKHINECIYKELLKSNDLMSRIFDAHGTALAFVGDMDNGPEHANKFWKCLVNTTAFAHVVAERHINHICISELILDDLDPLLMSLQRNCAIETVVLWGCEFTERGALAWGNILKQKKTGDTGGGFMIKEFTAGYMEGSTAWVDGLLENKTITNLALQCLPILHSAIKFIQKSPQLKEADLKKLTTEPEVGIDFHTLQHQEKQINLETFDIEFDVDVSISPLLCQGIGDVFCRANKLKKLKLKNFKLDIPKNFLKNAIYCDSLQLRWSDFDPHCLSSLINDNNGNGGKLKDLTIDHPKNMSNVELFFELVDLSLLDSFTGTIFSDGSMDALCRQLAENKGPKQLDISIFHNTRSFVWDKNNEFLSRLASSISGNDKIERLELSVSDIGHDLGLQRELVNAMGKMPRLKSWKVNFNERLSQENIQKWKEWILHQVQSNWNIQEIHLPSSMELGNDIKDVLFFNKHWRKLFCHHDLLSSGIWSKALSRIKTVGLMYLVVQQVPSLMTEAASQQDVMPSFVVPHHPLCPGCRCMSKKRPARSQHIPLK